ncbi:MAG: serine protease [Fimbriimonadaceae bacterium]|nr:serine protease [Fimbriimonadaceae bacterium]
MPGQIQRWRLTSAMSFLAASLAVAITQFDEPQERFIDTPIRAVNSYQSAAWNSIVDAVAVLPDSHGKPFGLAVMIDDKGHFVAHVSSLVEEPITAKMSGGLDVRLGRIGFDKETQLVLLGAQNWVTGKRQAVRVAPEVKKGELMVATVNGPVRGQLTSDSRPGIFLPSLRFVPLAEIQLESKDFPVGGGVVFDNSGSLVGILGAILNPMYPETAMATQSVRNDPKQFGPAGLTVAYALGPKILNRIVKGFRTESHKVEHPSVGIFFREGDGPGQIIVDEITKGSPCDLAGVKAGDQIMSANGVPMGNVIDLAAMLFELEPGSDLTLKLYRNGEQFEAKMKVGVQKNLS